MSIGCCSFIFELIFATSSLIPAYLTLLLLNNLSAEIFGTFLELSRMLEKDTILAIIPRLFRAIRTQETSVGY